MAIPRTIRTPAAAGTASRLDELSQSMMRAAYGLAKIARRFTFEDDLTSALSSLTRYADTDGEFAATQCQAAIREFEQSQPPEWLNHRQRQRELREQEKQERAARIAIRTGEVWESGGYNHQQLLKNLTEMLGCIGTAIDLEAAGDGNPKLLDELHAIYDAINVRPMLDAFYAAKNRKRREREAARQKPAGNVIPFGYDPKADRYSYRPAPPEGGAA